MEVIGGGDGIRATHEINDQGVRFGRITRAAASPRLPVDQTRHRHPGAGHRPRGVSRPRARAAGRRHRPRTARVDGGAWRRSGHADSESLPVLRDRADAAAGGAQEGLRPRRPRRRGRRRHRGAAADRRTAHARRLRRTRRPQRPTPRRLHPTPVRAEPTPSTTSRGWRPWRTPSPSSATTTGPTAVR
ncbi:hypothetical protein G5V59_27615 [Nocardioides sp. W3-2-3]|nr:hypothetical protein [Nocardioides convexus]